MAAGANAWSDEEVLCLINLWGEESIQEQLEGSKRNKHVYEGISKDMKKKKYIKTAEQCHAKMKKLKLEYRKIKDKHGKTGEKRISWKFYESLNAILANKPTTKPPGVLDTSECNTKEQANTTDEDGEDAPTVADDCEDDQLPIPPESPSNSASASKKRRRTKDEKIESIFTGVVKEMVEAQKESDKMFVELEEKRMKHEADQRKEECEFQLKMMSMLFGNQGSSMMPGPYGGAYQPFHGTEL